MEPLENLYFNWLCAKVIDVNLSSPSLTYWNLLRLLHRTEFVWVQPMDYNRASDGKELRKEFLIAADIPDHPEWRLGPGCSCLEMFIGFARRAEWVTEDPVPEWFWEFMSNLGLREYPDANSYEYEMIDILDTFIWRTYLPDGQGGLFPLDNPPEDERNVELWYQFNHYLTDHEWDPGTKGVRWISTR